VDPRLDSVCAEEGDTDSGRHQISNIGEMDELLTGLIHAPIVRTPRPNGSATGTLAAVERRIFGMENEYGVTCTLRGQRRLSPDEVARYLFRRVVSWGRSSNVFLENGARLYLDVGSHPEYATPECDSLYDLVAHDRAGERVLEGLLHSAEQRLAEEGIRGDVYLFKNNTDSAGNSYGCHENYLVSRQSDFQRMIDTLIPFFVSRQIWAGAGKLLQTARGTVYSMAQRSEHIWEGVSSATTRSRPIINTRDEPHADAERYRRLHVIAGDSNMSEYVTYVKVGATAALLQMLEDDVVFRDLTLENPIRAIREISHDITCRRKIRLANGRELSALDIQWEYLERVMRYSRTTGFPKQVESAIAMWEHLLTGLEKDPLSLRRECDWVAKYHLIEDYRASRGLALNDPKLALIDLAYHDVVPERGLYFILARRGMMERIVTEADVTRALTNPPETTRAKLRGSFIKAAKARNRDFTVDWVHLKLNDQAQRTVLCKDPFRAVDERVDKLIESL
jgi:proteasome accessory factor A